MILNLMFFFSRVAKYLILKKINKKMEFFNQTFVIELIMFIFGILMFQWSWNLRNIMSCVIADTCVQSLIEKLNEISDVIGTDLF